MARSFPVPVRALVFSAAAVLLTGFAKEPALAGASGPFLAHQALYELKLVKSRGTNAINGARGRILYNFSGSACEGYTSEFRQVSELDSGEGRRTLSDLRSHSWEDADGKVWLTYNSPQLLQERHNVPAELTSRLNSVGALLEKAVE